MEACHEFEPSTTKKTCRGRVGQRCTLNLSRAETSSRRCGVVVRRGVPAQVSSTSLDHGSKLRSPPTSGRIDVRSTREALRFVHVWKAMRENTIPDKDEPEPTPPLQFTKSCRGWNSGISIVTITIRLPSMKLPSKMKLLKLTWCEIKKSRLPAQVSYLSCDHG
ncbi:hypothetical protein TNCV_2468131 [Trichonephila clavipes]|nr:hypothetical protein TNCV_2468131 [Trichonephila clavipes]